jgi:hypothetical protein
MQFALKLFMFLISGYSRMGIDSGIKIFIAPIIIGYATVFFKK